MGKEWLPLTGDKGHVTKDSMSRYQTFCCAIVCFSSFGQAASAQSSTEIDAARGALKALSAARPDKVPEGTLVSVEHYLDIVDKIHDKGGQGANTRRYFEQAKTTLDDAADGRDALADKRGFVVRAYRSEVSQKVQPYSLYVPEGYDPTKATPLLVVLHGGSSNHNLFLGVVFGNNLDWDTYSAKLLDRFDPRFHTDWLVVAPNGFGQVMWRWMGEDDVLDVIEDVQRHYNVDPDRIVLNGISNGGVGSYSVGARHAWRFAAVLPMAGAPSWWQYLVVKTTPLERRLISAYGAWDSADNLRNTDHFEFFHGSADTGPMRPHFPHQFQRHLKSLGVPHEFTEFDMGHDIMYRVHQRFKLLGRIDHVRRNPRPEKVWVVAWDYRARRQHWLQVEHIMDFNVAARLTGEVRDEGRRLVVSTKNVDEMIIHLSDCPVASDGEVEVVVDDVVATTLGESRPEQLVLSRRGWRWTTERRPSEPGQLRKRPGLSGPLTDVLHTCQVHVYGTGVEGDTKTLRKTAQRAAMGLWTQWAWDYRQEVVADSELTDEMVGRCSLVLYGDTRSNSVLAKVAERLPIKIEPGAIVVGEKRLTSKRAGTRFIYPNPLAPDRYLVVQAGNTAKAVAAGNNLPDFLPDYVVYDEGTTARRPRGIFTRRYQPVMAGFFYDDWQLR